MGDHQAPWLLSPLSWDMSLHQGPEVQVPMWDGGDALGRRTNSSQGGKGKGRGEVVLEKV